MLIQENSSWMKDGGREGERTTELGWEGKACRHQRKYHSEKNGFCKEKEAVKKRKGGEGWEVQMELALHHSIGDSQFHECSGWKLKQGKREMELKRDINKQKKNFQLITIQDEGTQEIKGDVMFKVEAMDQINTVYKAMKTMQSVHSQCTDRTYNEYVIMEFQRSALL